MGQGAIGSGAFLDYWFLEHDRKTNREGRAPCSKDCRTVTSTFRSLPPGGYRPARSTT